MTKIKTLLALGGVGALLFAGANQALADPPSGVTPAHIDIVGTGSDATQYLTDKWTTDYNSSHSSAARKWYSWDAVGSSTIVEKADCGNRARPSGTSTGISELEANLRPTGDTKDYCVDYARSARGRSASNPADPNTILFLPYAIDGVTWSADTLTGSTNARPSLTSTQLNAIYSCDASLLGTGKTGPVTWKELGGASTDRVIPVIPLSVSAVRKFFLQEIGNTTLGTCVQGQDNSVEQSEGTNPIFQNLATAPDIVFPYSVADYLAQSQNGHNPGEQGSMVLRGVNGKSPTTTNTTTGLKSINLNFPYLHDVYNVVRNVAADPSTSQVVPTYLQGLFGNGTADTGWVCRSAASQADIRSYGFRPLTTAQCGIVQ